MIMSNLPILSFSNHFYIAFVATQRISPRFSSSISSCAPLVLKWCIAPLRQLLLVNSFTYGKKTVLH